MKRILNIFSVINMSQLKLSGLFLVIAFLSACEPIENEEGDNLTLCYDYYQACVSPLLNTQFAAGGTCASNGCHLIGGGGGGSFHVEATGNIDSFTSALSMVDLFDEDNSLLLTKPSGISHDGGAFPALASGSVCYNQIREWMDIVVTEQPADQRPNDPCATLPVCSVSDATAC